MPGNDPYLAGIDLVPFDFPGRVTPGGQPEGQGTVGALEVKALRQLQAFGINGPPVIEDAVQAIGPVQGRAAFLVKILRLGAPVQGRGRLKKTPPFQGEAPKGFLSTAVSWKGFLIMKKYF
jgi:hypothetical protein